MHHLTYLQPVSLPKADADAGSKGPSRHTADHNRHALLTGVIALQLYLSAQLAVREVGFVASTVDRETPVVLLTAHGQQSKTTYYNNTNYGIFLLCPCRISWKSISSKKLQSIIWLAHHHSSYEVLSQRKILPSRFIGSKNFNHYTWEI